MTKHKLHAAALLVSVVLCFFVVSPMLIQGTSAFVFGHSHICRANFYAEVQESSMPESSVPESSMPESSDEKPPTGDGLNILPLMAMLLCSMLTVGAVWVSGRRLPKHENTED